MTSVTRLNSSGSISSIGENTDVIALFTQTSIGPNSRSTFSAALSIAAGSATSAGRTSARPPPCSISFFAESRRSWLREMSPTDAPCSPKSRAMARPRPAEAPVITTTSGFLAWLMGVEENAPSPEHSNRFGHYRSNRGRFHRT